MACLGFRVRGSGFRVEGLGFDGLFKVSALTLGQSTRGIGFEVC